ncbi:MAG: hypothetical protein ABFD18_15350 [Syntrophomonas sp.]
MNMVKSFNKALVAVFLLVGFLFVTILPVNASNEIDSCQEKQVVFSKQPITDEAVLFERAKKGETDFIGDQSFIKDITFDEKVVKDFNTKSYVTTQKLKEVKGIGEEEKTGKEKSYKEESYVSTVFVELSPKSYDNGSSSLTQPVVDPTASIRCTTTVYFSYRKDVIGSLNWYSGKLDRVNAKWDILDSQMRISNGYVRGTANGRKVTSFDPHTEGSLINHTSGNEYSFISSPTSGTTYNYYPSWNDWINVYPESTHVGSKPQITITRIPTGTSWDFSYWLKVNYVYFPVS